MKRAIRAALAVLICGAAMGEPIFHPTFSSAAPAGLDVLSMPDVSTGPQTTFMAPIDASTATVGAADADDNQLSAPASDDSAPAEAVDTDTPAPDIPASAAN